MYHSLTFIDVNNANNKRNTWDDWHLIPSSRPVISPPGVQTKSVEIPGLNGSIDLTEVMTGYPIFKNRSGSIEFYVENDYWHWEVAYSEIMRFLHGRRMRCVLEDDPSYFYEGRFAVSDWKSDKTHSKITIQYDVYPYKKEVGSTDTPWEWDPFSFESGVIQPSGSIEAGDSITIVGNDEPVVPTFTFSNVEGSVTVTHIYSGASVSHTVTANGTKKWPDIVLRKGENRITTAGDGTILVSYRGGML